MVDSAPNTSRLQRPILVRLLWPVGLVFLATVWVMLSAVLWIGHGLNEAALGRDREQVLAAMSDVAGSITANAAARLASDQSRPSRAGTSSGALDRLQAILPEAEYLFVANPGLDGIAGRHRGVDVPDSQARAVLAALRSSPSWTLPAAGKASFEAVPSIGLIAMDGRLFAASGIQPDTHWIDGRIGEGLVVLAWLPVEPAKLRRAAELRGVRALSPAGAGQALVSVPGGTHGERPVDLTWQPSSPIPLDERHLVLLAVLGFVPAIVLFGAAIVRLHRLTRDLVVSTAHASERLGKDPVSGLANRLLFTERLDGELERCRQGVDALAVLFIDLDRFKSVNDTYGHQAGDLLIQLVAERLVNVLCGTELLARFGGDEFAIIQAGIVDSHAPQALSRRILDALTQPFTLAHSSVTIGASIGVAMAPTDGVDRETLMQRADAALYQAKGEGRNRFCVFEKHIDEALRLRRVVEDDLRRAIEGDQLQLVYQPIYTTHSKEIVAVEALVRWPHPRRGLIGPAEFIPLAEESGLIIALGEWVLRRACKDAARWPDLRVAVNVSPIQFRNRAFVASVAHILRETGLEPGRLELELTEGVVVDDADAAEADMLELRAAGVHLALDDFGTGYSSLIYLRRFAIDTIKIDRSFLESLESTGECAVLVHSIVALGRALGLTVTAEGVETSEQQRFLQALGCHQMQGYLFSRPVPKEAIDELLGEKRSSRVAA